MRRGGLVWYAYRPYVLVTALALVVVGALVAHDTRSYLLDQVRADLIVRAWQYGFMLGGTRPADYQATTVAFSGTSNTRYTLIDGNGRVLADSEADPTSMDDHSARPEVVGALAGRVGCNVRASITLKRPLMYVAIPAGDGRVVRSAVPVPTLWQTAHHVLDRFLWGALLIAALAGLASLLTLRGLGAAMARLRNGANQMAAGDLSVRLASPPIAELADLTSALNAMSQELNERLMAIQNGRRQLEAVLKSMAEGVMTLDNAARVTNLNPAAARLLDVEDGAGVGRTLFEVARHRDVQRFAERALAGEETVQGEIVWFLGGERYLLVRASRLRDQAGNQLGALIVLHDVTEIRRLEQVRRDFVGDVSHELRTPVASIKGAAETLQSGALDDPDAARRFVDVIARHADRLQRIIEDLLSLSRLEQIGETQSIELVPTEVAEVGRAAAAVVAESAEARAVRLEVDCQPGLVAKANPPLLEQAIVNLLDNAVKYSQPGQTVTLSAHADEREVAIEIKDAGCGIAPDHLPRLFERFYRVDKARSRTAGGTGLGLSIAKHIAQAHGGSISVESEPGRGSTFTIHLPTYVAGGEVVAA